MLNLTAKERFLLEDEKTHEQLCIQKYHDYANKAMDPQLKTLFTQLAQKEESHLNSINQMLNGVVPNINQQQGQSQQRGQSQQIQQQHAQQVQLNVQMQQPHVNEEFFSNDKMLCQDSLSTEKYVSSTYNTAIFEFKDKNARQVLNHIQKEEQEHGEQIYNYMNQHGMYN